MNIINSRAFSVFLFQLIILIPLILLFNCSNSSKLTEIKVQPTCTTTIEGFYAADEEWKGGNPALIIREGNKSRFLRGELISYDEEGVTFDPARESPFFDPKPQYYKFDDVELFVDEKGNIVVGTMPKKLTSTHSLELYLSDINKPGTKPFKMLLKPNGQFGYCIPSGTYEITEIRFIDKASNVDAGVNYPKLILSVKENHANYLGKLYLNINQPELSDSIIIPYKLLSRSNAWRAGYFGGILGSTAVAASTPAGIIGERKLLIVDDTNTDIQLLSKSKFNFLKIQIAQ